MPRPHSQIVRDAGSFRQIGRELCVPHDTVQSWARRSSIPAEYWAEFDRREWSTLAELAAAAEARRLQAA